MPIYTYECPKCGTTKDEMHSIYEDAIVASDPCYVCLEPMKKVLSPTAGYVKGTTNPVKIK
jgi:putative FmdB family regulatory protein